MKRLGSSLALVALLLAGAYWVLQESEVHTGNRYFAVIAFAPGGNEAFISGQEAGAISIFSFADNRQSDHFSVDGVILAMVFHPDGSKAYVLSTLAGRDTIDVIDVAKRRVASRILVSPCNARNMAISPDGRMLLLASGFARPSCAVQVDTATLLPSQIATPEVNIGETRTVNSVVSADASRIVSTLQGNVFARVRGAYAVVTRSMGGGGEVSELTLGKFAPSLVATNPDNTTLAMADHATGPGQPLIRLVNLAGGATTDIAASELLAPLVAIAFSADSRQLYAVVWGDLEVPARLLSFEVDRPTAMKSMALRVVPDGMALSPDGSKLVLLANEDLWGQVPSNQVGLVTVIDTRTRVMAPAAPLKASLAQTIWVMADRLAAHLPGASERHRRILSCP
ncbi:MAG: hypothetical protein ACJ8GW_12975 [Massilia sp.]